MNDFDEKIREDLSMDIKLPSVVNEKWAAGMELIEKGEVKQEKKKNNVLRIAFSSVGTIAAAFAILVGVSFVNPVFADNIPFMNNIIGFLKGTNNYLGQNQFITEGGVEEYTKPVEMLTDDSPITVTQSYSDGDTIVLGLALEIPEVPEDYDTIEAAFSFKVDGKDPTWQENYVKPLTRAEGDMFVTSLALETKGMELSDTADVSISAEGIRAVDHYLMLMDDNGKYAVKQQELSLSSATAECRIEVDKELFKTEELNISDNGYSISKLTTTPAFTRFDISAPEDAPKPYVWLVTDDLGNSYNLLKYGSEDENGLGVNYSAVKKGATKLVISFYDKADKTTPLAVLNVPVSEGYAGNEDIYKTAPENTKEIVFDPPLEETKSQLMEEGDKLYEFGDVISQTSNESGSLARGSLDLSFSNYKVYDSYQAAGIDNSDMLESCMSWFDDKNSEDYKFITFDVTFTGHDALSLFTDAEEGVQEGSGSSCFWISDYTSLAIEGYPNDDSVYSYSDTDYFSDHMNGMSDYYHLILEPNGTRTVTVGYIVKTSALESGKVYIKSYAMGDEVQRSFKYIDSEGKYTNREGTAYANYFTKLPTE